MKAGGQPARPLTRETAAQAGRYLVGAFIALGLDLAIVTALLHWGLPVVAARLVALLAGMTTTYAFNRRYTFDATHPASLLDWARYVAAQSFGTSINFGLSTGLLYVLGRAWWQVWAAVLVGAAAGFAVNFFVARRLLHRRGGSG